MYEISQGGSPSEVIVKSVAGLVAGAAAASAIGALYVSAPVWMPVGAALGAGVVVASSVSWAWSTWVPLEARDGIDEGLRDSWDALAEAARGSGGILR